jgi:hypothetical protein
MAMMRRKFEWCFKGRDESILNRDGAFPRVAGKCALTMPAAGRAKAGGWRAGGVGRVHTCSTVLAFVRRDSRQDSREDSRHDSRLGICCR